MTRPLLYVSSILPQIDPDLVADGSVDEMVQFGIDRLLSMQTPSGGFGVWPGSSDPVLWGTAYVVHLFLDARDAGYAVPQTALDDAVGWLDRHAESDSGGPKFRGTHPGYVQYVLARAGKPHAAQVARLLAGTPTKGLSGRDAEGRYLLEAALYQAGDRRYEQRLRAVDTSAVSSERLNDWSYYSDLRRRGMMLATYHELFGRDRAGTALADLVADELEQHRGGYFTTQELMWGVTGLGKWVGAPPDDLPTPKLWFNGSEVPVAKERAGKGQVAWQISGASRGTQLEVELPKKADGALTVVGTTEGIRPDVQAPLGGEGLTVRRRHHTAAGPTLPLRDHDLGDLVYVELTLRNTSHRRMENLALVDRIPAGWEIENPRLGRGALPEWAQAVDLWRPEYMDLRDDRFQVFGPLEGGQEVTVVYAVRAVTAGTFAVPPVYAEAMYDPRVWARAAGATAVIDGGWGDYLE